MKKLKIILLVSCLFFLTGCREYGEKRIVKLITIDKENITLYYYGYSKEKPEYLKEEKANNGIENTIVEMLGAEKYDLKLCEYAVCDSDTVKNEAEKVFRALMDSKFSPDIAILEGNTVEESEKYIELEGVGYPLYNFQIKDDKITGFIENADNKQKNIILNSQYYSTLDNKQSIITDILTDNMDKCEYVFESEEKMLSAALENISVFNFKDKNQLLINITANLKSYKGMTADESQKQKFIKLLEKSIYENTEILLNDRTYAKAFGLLWYEKVYDFDHIKINVNIL